MLLKKEEKQRAREQVMQTESKVLQKEKVELVGGGGGPRIMQSFCFPVFEPVCGSDLVAEDTKVI